MVILRTLLFVPGNQQRRIEKARNVPADALILDLEDSVPVSEKDVARQTVAGSVEGLSRGERDVLVRINSLQTPFAAADIGAVVARGLRGICLPKSESAEDVRKAEALLAAAESGAGLAPGSVGVLALVETPRGLLNAYEVAAASARVIGLAFGAEDYALEMGVRRTRGGAEIHYPRAALAVAARAAGVMAVDSVYTDVRDTDGLIEETRAVLQLGFRGKLVIHPGQVEPVNRVFAPSAEEVERACRVVQAFDEALAGGRASVSLDGQMIDAPVAERARRVLALSEAIQRRRPGATGGDTAS